MRGPSYNGSLTKGESHIFTNIDMEKGAAFIQVVPPMLCRQLVMKYLYAPTSRSQNMSNVIQFCPQSGGTICEPTPTLVGLNISSTMSHMDFKLQILPRIWDQSTRCGVVWP